MEVLGVVGSLRFGVYYNLKMLFLEWYDTTGKTWYERVIARCESKLLGAVHVLESVSQLE